MESVIVLAFGRPAGYWLEIEDDFAHAVCYTCEMDERMDTTTITDAQGRTVSVGYDWNPIYERSEHPSEGAAELAYFQGPDLSGALQGAGGVGGLVAVSVDGYFYFPGYDNNGNVVGYWDESGSLVAEYVYDAFGNTISSSGSMASVFPHRFSTKYYDAETDLYYYGYRYYSPSLGRWISRDPMGENDSPGLFLSCRNNLLGLIDRLGLHRMITGALLDKPNPQQDPSILRDPGVDIARDILRLLEKLNQLVDRNGKRYRAEIKDLVITPMASVPIGSCGLCPTWAGASVLSIDAPSRNRIKF